MKTEGLCGIRREKTRKTTISRWCGDPAPRRSGRPRLRRSRTQRILGGGPDLCPHARRWVYCAFILDVFSRMVVGWQVSTSLRTDLALDALDMGLWARQRAGQDVAGLTHHWDRGVQYRAIRYTERLAEAEAVASVGSKGDSYDNAMAEAFNSLFKAECIRNPVMRPKGGWK